VTDIDYRAPSRLDEAIALLAGEGARSLAGGTDLMVQMRSGRLNPGRIVDLKRIPEMLGVREVAGGFEIGAATACAAIGEHAALATAWPGVVEAARLIGSAQVQGRASLGGNLCNASPSADVIPSLMVHGATAQVAGERGVRTVAVGDFCTAPGRTCLADGEILVRLCVPLPPARSGSMFLRFTPRNEMDIAVVSVGAAVVLDAKLARIVSARIALGAVAPTPLLAQQAGALLAGQEPGDAAYQQAAEAARGIISPIDDMRGTREFRRHVTGVLVRRALETAVARARHGV